MTTGSLPFDASAADVLFELDQIFGVGNVTVSGGPANVTPFTITFIGRYQGQILAAPRRDEPPDGRRRSRASSCTRQYQARRAGPDHLHAERGRRPRRQQRPGPRDRRRQPDRGCHGLRARRVRQHPPRPDHRRLRRRRLGPAAGRRRQPDPGQLHRRLLPLPGRSRDGRRRCSPRTTSIFAGIGNPRQGVYLDGSNTTVGGTDPQENNVIAGNGLQGVLIDFAAMGNVVEGNQIGIIGPSDNGRYAQAGNGAEGVLIYGSSNVDRRLGQRGRQPDLGNTVAGVQIVGAGGDPNIVGANLIGLGPGGGFLFGTGNPGNVGDGVRIEDSASNQVGGPDATWGNVISSNTGAGVYITGAGGRGQFRPQQPHRPDRRRQGRQGQLRRRRRRLLAPDGHRPGQRDLGQPPRRPDLRRGRDPGRRPGQPDRHRHHRQVRPGQCRSKASGSRTPPTPSSTGDAKGSQVISGNHQGVVIAGASSTRNLVAGNLIGSDKTGLAAMPNAQEGVAILGATGNTIGGTTSSALEPDLGQPLGRAARRGRCHGQPRGGELTSAPTSPARPRWATRSTA